MADLRRMADQVKQVLGMTGRAFRIEVQYGARNAYAFWQGGEPVIAFDLEWLNRLRAGTGTDWTVLGVVAHELGHHYYYHLTFPLEPHTREVAADYAAGFALAQLGAPDEVGARLMGILASEKPTASHPGRQERIEAFNRVFRDARISTDQFAGARAPRPR